MLTPQAIETIEAALRRVSEEWYAWQDEYKRIEAALAELKEVKAVMQYADYPLDEETALRTERQGQRYSHRNGEFLTPDQTLEAHGTYWVWSKDEGFWTDYWGGSDGWSGFDGLYTGCCDYGPIPEPDRLDTPAPPANLVVTQWTPIEGLIHITIGKELDTISAHRIADWELGDDYAVCRRTKQEGNADE